MWLFLDMSQILISSMLPNIASIMAWITPFFCCLGMPFIPLTAHWDVLSESAFLSMRPKSKFTARSNISIRRALSLWLTHGYSASAVAAVWSTCSITLRLACIPNQVILTHLSWFKDGQFITHLFLNLTLRNIWTSWSAILSLKMLQLKICTQRGGKNLIIEHFWVFYLIISTCKSICHDIIER